jgi:hypothetical protein
VQGARSPGNRPGTGHPAGFPVPGHNHHKGALMRRRLGSYLIALAVVTLIGVTVATPAQAIVPTFTIQNIGSNWCLDGLPPLALQLFTNSNETTLKNELCENQDGDTAYLWTFVKASDLTCVRSYCGKAYYISPYSDSGYCLSQNNARSAYLTTPCTHNDYQTWIFWNSSGDIPGTVLTYLISRGSVNSSTTWCLSSNESPPDGYPSGYGSVYSAGISIYGYHLWYILPVSPG